MADEVALRVAVRHGQTCQQADHLVAAPVPVVVVERLEVVQVGIAGDEFGTAVQQPLHVQAGGDVAGQESERVGVACGLDARLCHAAHQLVARAQAHVAPVVGHDEAVVQVALVLRREDAHQLVHVAVQLDHAGRMVGDGAAGLAAMHFAEIERGVVVHELLAVDERHGAGALQHRQRVQFGVVAEEAGHLVVVRVGRDGGRMHHQQVAQDARPRSVRLVRQHGHTAVVQRPVRSLFDERPRCLGRAAQQVALAVGDVQVAQRAQVFVGFDALCHERGAEHLGNALDGLQHLQLLGMDCDVAHEVLVDLHEVRLHLGPEAQARMAVPEVVQRQPGPAGVHGTQRVQQSGHVGDAFVLGDLDHQHARRHAQAAHLAAQQAFAAKGHGTHQGIGADVQEEPARAALAAPLLQRDDHAEHFEILQQSFFAGALQQRVGAMQCAALGAAYQGLVCIDGSFPQIGQRLEDAMQQAAAHQLCEGAAALPRCGG